MSDENIVVTTCGMCAYYGTRKCEWRDYVMSDNPTAFCENFINKRDVSE